MDSHPFSILDCIGKTPLVPMTRIAAGLATPLFAKCEHLNPGGSVKESSGSIKPAGRRSFVQ
jgi:cysteine synthase